MSEQDSRPARHFAGPGQWRSQAETAQPGLTQEQQDEIEAGKPAAEQDDSPDTGSIRRQLGLD